MKRFLMWALMLTACISLAFAENNFTYVGCSPTSGSKITSFEFTLEFNYDGVIAELGEGEYGIGWASYYNASRPDRTQAVELYEGDRDTGTFLARTLTTTTKGNSADFKLGNTVAFSFPDFIPETDKVYNLYVSNQFIVNKKGSTSNIASNSVNFYNSGDKSSNLVLSFVGASGASESLSLESTSIRSQQELEVLSTITYTFNNPISVNSDAMVQLKDGDSVIATSTKFEKADEKSVTFSFDNVELLLSHSYILTLPEGVVSMTSDSNQKNAAFDITINGSMTKLIDLNTVSPENGAKEILSSIRALFNVPAGYKLYSPEGIANSYVAKLYQSDISDENLQTSIQGAISQGNTVIWDLPSMSLIPATKYIISVPEGQFGVYNGNNKLANEYSNAEVYLEYSTPSIEEAGYAPMELGKPTLRGGVTVINEGDSFASLDRLEIAPPELKYEYDGVKVGFFADDESRAKGYLYDITGDSPVLVKEFLIDTQTRETATEYYNILCFFINSILYEGHEYMIEMPEGAFTIASQRLWNYVRTPGFSIKVKGSTPTEVNLMGTSIEEGAERSALNDVIFRFNGDLTPDREASALLNEYDANDKLRNISNIPLTSYVSGNETYVSAHVGNQATGEPRTLTKDYTYTLTIPAGCVYVAALPEIANKETSLTIKGVEAPPVVVEPEYVSLEVSYLDTDKAIVNTTSTEIVKGKNIRIQVPSELWKIASLMRYKGEEAGSNVTDFVENGVYTSSAINDNTRFEVALEYAAPLVFSDMTTGIAELPDSNIQVFSDGDTIVVKGLAGGEFITVYTMAGITVGSHEVATDKDTVNISATTGQTYIVRVQKADGYDYAAKIMH